MDTETMIRELESVENKHKYDKVFTGQVNIAEMAHDVRKRLEKLKPYEDTGLTPEQIMELKHRDTEEEITEIQTYGVYFYECPICNEPVHEKDNFCCKCGQRLKLKEEN